MKDASWDEICMFLMSNYFNCMDYNKTNTSCSLILDAIYDKGCIKNSVN